METILPSPKGERVNLVVFDYGAGNVHSACQALRNLGADVQLTDSPQEALNADGVLVPGVGAFQYVMDRFTERSGPEIVQARLEENKPVLGICVGMQIFFESATEKGQHQGLGRLSGVVESLPGPRLPHMGWSIVEAPEGSRMFQGIDSERFYFVHSYARRLNVPITDLMSDQQAKTATSTYGVPFAAAVEDGPLWATQFHPEKSGSTGLRLLTNWLRFIEEENK